ncbi:Dienelactone hydrolase [Seinonella peptonophila]|uniref:Dienelactone hydrolase n=1 Tax=Seinonella peptonophila TaxID=112248 RepID=A0A1M4U989_9BACL|nr:CocE/NonD family hydrolase [Seinonella peptonophila]SHE53285.1 Dienelactone hydrolase [Seinonella peptonophila]
MISEKAIQRMKLYHLLGELPLRSREISVEDILIEEREHYDLEKLLLDLNGIELVPAYFVKPKHLPAKTPTILFNHSHGGFYQLGKNELLEGNVYLQAPPYAEVLAREGYSTLCIDAWGFGERAGKTESEIFKEMLWSGQIMWGMMVYDSLKAIDYLVSRQDVDNERIGTLGMSMGSTMAWWIAALDTRIKVCVDICCLTDFQALIDSRGLDEHGIYYYVPHLIRNFTTSQINALISPRPHLSLAGNYDKLTPLDGLKRIDKDLKAIYESDNASESWKLQRYDSGHLETKEMRSEVLSFLHRWL